MVRGSLVASALSVVGGAGTHSEVPATSNWKMPPSRDCPLAATVPAPSFRVINLELHWTAVLVK